MVRNCRDFAREYGGATSLSQQKLFPGSATPASPHCTAHRGSDQESKRLDGFLSAREIGNELMTTWVLILGKSIHANCLFRARKKDIIYMFGFCSLISDAFLQKSVSAGAKKVKKNKTK